LFAKINIGFSIIISLLLFTLAPILIKLFFTPEFDKAIIILRIMSLSLVFLALCNTYGTNYLILQGYEKKLRNITFVCSIIGMIISWPLIYYFNAIGAAIAVTTTRGLLGFSSYLAVKK
jgi:hypothetical protein